MTTKSLQKYEALRNEIEIKKLQLELEKLKREGIKEAVEFYSFFTQTQPNSKQPKFTLPQLYILCEAAYTWNISHTFVLTNAYSIKDDCKIEVSARLMNAIIRSHKHDIHTLISTHQCCTLKGVRADTKASAEVTFSIQDAIKAGLVKKQQDNQPQYQTCWDKYTDRMLYARCLSKLAAQLFPDCIEGIYIQGEVQEENNPIIPEELPTTPEEHQETAFVPSFGLSNFATEQEVHSLQLLMQEFPEEAQAIESILHKHNTTLEFMPSIFIKRALNKLAKLHAEKGGENA